MEDRLQAPARIPLWAWFVVAFAALVVYAVTLDNGLLLRGAANTAHELLHDGRHFLGVPCH